MRICSRALSVSAGDAGYFEIETDCGVAIRLWFLTEDIIRIRAGFDQTEGIPDWDEASYAVVMTAWESRTDALLKEYRRRVRPAEADLTEDGESWLLRGGHLSVEIKKDPLQFVIRDSGGRILHEDCPGLPIREDSNRRRIHTSVINKNDHFYGFGEKSGRLNKAGKLVTMSAGDTFAYDPENTDPLYKHIPFYIRLNSETCDATGYFYDCTAACEFNMGREIHNYWPLSSAFRADAGDLDLYFIAGPGIDDVVRRYTDLTGKPAMLPMKALGYLGSSMYYAELPENCDDAILGFADTAAQNGIPMDGFQLSSGYCSVDTAEGQKRCSFTWNRERFRDPAAWLSEMKKRGIPVTANIKPGMLLVHPLLEEMKAKGVFVRSADGKTGEDSFEAGAWWGGRGLFFDFTSDSARAYWKELIRKNLLEYGCTSIWNDNCEYDCFTDLDARVSFEGKGGTIGELRPVMPTIMAHIACEAITGHDPKERPFVLNRAGYAGIQRYAQTWAGDNATSWESLRYNIATILGMGLSGCANEGCDVGGFAGDAPGEELFVRWVQNGIFMPRFSIHSVNSDNTVTEPWMYSGSCEIIRNAIRFRYRLMPYFYSLEWRAHETGLPILAPKCALFQSDRNTWDDDTDMMLGDFLLAATVVEQGAEERRIWLPAGTEWYDFYTREHYRGGQEITVPITLESIPLFVGSGAVLPMTDDDPMKLTDRGISSLRILLAPDWDSSFVLYEDDGATNGYLKGDALKTTVEVAAGPETVVSFRSEGGYSSRVRKITLDVIHRKSAPHAVRKGDAELVHYLDRNGFEAADEGWYYSMTLRSVLIKYDAPGADHEIHISFGNIDMIKM